MLKKFALSIIIWGVFVSGCSIQNYYKNINPAKSNQVNFNMDAAQCEAIAQRARAGVPIQIYTPPPQPQPFHGQITTITPSGDIYNSDYMAVPTPGSYNYDQEMLGMTQSFISSMNADNVYYSTKNACMTQRGWYQISKEEYLRSQSTPQPIYQSSSNADNKSQSKISSNHVSVNKKIQSNLLNRFKTKI